MMCYFVFVEQEKEEGRRWSTFTKKTKHADKLDELFSLATSVKSDPTLIDSHMPILLPDGWVYRIFGNCVIAAFQDGEQERKAFFVPRIWIEFMYVNKIEANKSIEERLPLGYCSCGKRMPFAQVLLWASDMVQCKGFWSLPSKVIGYMVGSFLGIYLLFSPKQLMSLQFNRHPSCL